jgi:hypothetical protein
MCTVISLTTFQHLCTSMSITTCCPSRHRCLASEVYHMLPAPPLTTFLLTPILSTSLHPRYLSYPSTIRYIFVTPIHFPVYSIWPRHTAQRHLHSPLAHYSNNPPCPPLYVTPVFPHTACISCTILKTEAASSSITLIAISKSTQHDIPQD